MKKNRRKGVALLSAVILMSVIVCFLLLLYAIISGFIISNKYEAKKLSNESVINEIYGDFIDNGSIDGVYNGITNEVVVSQSDSNVKAVVATSGGKMMFYAIYDFGLNNLLAMQKKNFYITQKVDGGKTYYYLADMVRYKEIE